jgi:hypothetical protein
LCREGEPPDARRAPEERATHERAGSRLAGEQRAGLGEGGGHGGVVPRVDRRAPEPVGEPADAPREPLAEGGVQHAALRPGAGVARRQRALAGPGHAGDQKHHVGARAEDHGGRMQGGREAPVTARSTSGQGLLGAR